MSALIGWYSRKQESLLAGLEDFTVAIYKTAEGREVEVTEAIYAERGPSKFDDAVCVGELDSWVRSREAKP